MQTRPLLQADEDDLRDLLLRAAPHNLFHLSSLEEWGLPPSRDPYAPMWAVGAFRGEGLVGAAAATRGTGGIYHTTGDLETLHALARAAIDGALGGPLSLLSGHEEQVGALIPLVKSVRVSVPDYCSFCTLRPGELTLPVREMPDGFSLPRIASEADMERLIDFYMTGFYSLAYLPSRSAWRHRLLEQLRYRTLFVVKDSEGKVASAALSSAESVGGAMLGGVATLSQYLGRGLSTHNVGALCAYLFGRGRPLVSLFYLRGNTPAERVYEKLGFRRDGEWLLAGLGSFAE